MFRRITLAFAVAAIAAPTAQAVPLEPGATKAEYIPFVTDFPRTYTASHGETIQSGEYGMPTAMPSDYAANRVDRIELARLQDRKGNDVRGLDESRTFGRASRPRQARPRRERLGLHRLARRRHRRRPRLRGDPAGRRSGPEHQAARPFGTGLERHPVPGAGERAELRPRPRLLAGPAV